MSRNRRKLDPPRKRRKFDTEFKKDAVGLFLENGEPVNAIARRLDVPPSVLFCWKAKYEAEVSGEQPRASVALAAEERAELERLRKENAQLREDQVILRKAAAFFARESEAWA